MPTSISIDPFSAVDSVFDLSGNQNRADRAYQSSEKWNQIGHRFDREKFEFSKQQYRDQKLAQENRLQNLVKDAEAAGISVSTALGAAPASPVTVGIPGSTTKRVASNQYSNPLAGSSSLQIAEATVRTNNAVARKTEAEADKAELDNLVQLGIIPPDPGSIPQLLEPVNAIQDYYDRKGGKFEWLDPEFAESLDSVGGLFYMGVREAVRNVKEFWQQGQEFRHRQMYGE